MRLAAALICLTLCAGTFSSRAEPQLQSKMHATCRPANATSYTIVRWKPRESCTHDCFVSRLACSNGKSHELASPFHPATTPFQMTFYSWAPWSVFAYLLPLLAVAGVSAVGSRMIAPVLTVNALLVTYAAMAAWSLCASITGNPWSEWAWLEKALFLNPYSFAAAMVLFAIVNTRPVWRALEERFYRQPVSAITAPDILHVYPAAMSAALMPDIYEFVDPRESATHYRRETDRLRAFRDKLDAETAFAEAYIRRERARHHLDDRY